MDRAWARVCGIGASPSVSALGVLYGMLAIETGRDPKTGAAGYACWCWNLGNVRWVSSAGCDWCVLAGAPECVPNEPGKVYPPDPFCGPGMHSVPVGGAFRAYESLEDGAIGFLDFVKNHYPSAWAVLNEKAPMNLDTRGMANRYVHELKVHGYFTGPESTYASVVGGVAVHFPVECKAELAARFVGGAESMPVPSEESSSISTTDPQTPIAKGLSGAETLGLVIGGGAATQIRAGEGEHTPEGVERDLADLADLADVGDDDDTQPS